MFSRISSIVSLVSKKKSKNEPKTVIDSQLSLFAIFFTSYIWPLFMNVEGEIREGGFCLPLFFPLWHNILLSITNSIVFYKQT